MTIRHLKIFIAVYDRLSITHAAEALHMTQPVVTRTIKEIEQHYGVQLFDRMNRRLYVTNAGHHLYTHAKRVVEAFDHMEKEARNADGHFTLSIGSTLYLGSFLLPQILKELKERYPNAGIHARVSNAESLQRALHGNELDFALIEDHVEHPTLNSKPFFQDQLVLILPKDHPLLQKEELYMSDLEHKPFLLQEKGSISRRRVDDTFARHGLMIDPLLESRSTQAIIQSVSARLGLAFLPEHLVKNCIKCGLLVHRTIADESFSRKNYIVWHKDKFLSKPITQAMEICCKAVSELQGLKTPCVFRKS